MRISELVFEQTPIGTVGSTAGMTQPVGKVEPVSQTPSTNNKEEKPDPNVQQLAALLKQNRVIDNDKDMNDFIGAYTASMNKQTLNPTQQDMLGKLAGPLMNDPSLNAKIKLLAKVKPGQTNTTQAQGQQPA